jgi:hypothetical protein
LPRRGKTNRIAYNQFVFPLNLWVSEIYELPKIHFEPTFVARGRIN